MKPHQDRVIVEFRELQTKIDALKPFLGSEVFRGLDGLEQRRLISQLWFMEEYAKTLLDRITNFQ